MQFESFTQRTGALTTVLELCLTEPPVTSGTGLDATTEFLPLMASWAQSLEESNPEGAAMHDGGVPRLPHWPHEDPERFFNPQLLH
jgi:hypothetical protein